MLWSLTFRKLLKRIKRLKQHDWKTTRNLFPLKRQQDSMKASDFEFGNR